MFWCSSFRIICNSRFCNKMETKYLDDAFDAKNFSHLIRQNYSTDHRSCKCHRRTLNLLSCRTFLIATRSPLSHNLAWYTTPNEPFPITCVIKEHTKLQTFGSAQACHYHRHLAGHLVCTVNCKAYQQNY